MANPQEQGPQPPFPQQRQQWPGTESEMQPKPDFGESSYRGHERLKGKAAIITGGDSGIGRAVALAYAREGADVLISYLSEHSDAQKTVELVRESGRAAIAIAEDISHEDHCRQTYESIEKLPSNEWEYTFRTNIDAMYYLSKAALPRIPEGGAIINTASIQAYKPSPQLLAYATTKGAIVTFTKALAQQVIKRGIRVNAVAPGPVWTPLIPMSLEPDKVSQFGKDTPEGRPAQPKEMAPIYVFLASEESSYIVGEVIGATGGTPLP
jgi:NAD(P)-dependent dehydrogenase (short-subunit alcohol dehydrogenase family)